MTKRRTYEGRFRVCLRTPAGGCTDMQGNFRDEAEARRWAGKRPCWVVWTPTFSDETVKWTVKAKPVNSRAAAASKLAS